MKYFESIENKLMLWAAVVAQRLSARLVTEMSQVQILLGAELFYYFYPQ